MPFWAKFIDDIIDARRLPPSQHPAEMPEWVRKGTGPSSKEGMEQYRGVEARAKRDLEAALTKQGDPDAIEVYEKAQKDAEVVAQKLRRISAGKPVGAAIGGAAGYALTEDEDKKWRNAVGGAIIGGAVVPGALQALALGRTGPDKLSNYLFYSYLSSPDTVTRANLGAAGGMMTHAFEQLALGVMGDKQALRNGLETITAVPEAGRIWAKTLTGSQDEVRAIRKQIFGGAREGRFDMKNQAFRDVGLGRLFSAGDNAAVYAMTKGGIPVDEAMRFTLAGQPTSQLGEVVVGGTSRLLQSPNWSSRFAGATLAPFARVGMLGLEQGAKRIPLVGQFAEGGWRQGSQAMKNLRQFAEFPALGAAGYYADQYVDPRITQTAGTLAGPGFLPFQLGRELSQAHRASPTGLDADTALTAAGETFREFSPLGFNPLAMLSSTIPEEIARRLVPSGVSDVAETLDPAFGRNAGRQELQEGARTGEVPPWMGIPGVGAILNRLPGAREQLPQDFMPVNWTGQPLAPDLPFIPPSIAKSLFPSRESTRSPIVDFRANPELRRLAQMGETFTAPSGEVRMPGMMGQLLGPMQLGQRATGQVQRVRGRGAEASAAVMKQLAPYLERLPEPLRSRMYRILSARIEQPINEIETAAARAIGMGSGGRFRV